MKRHALKAALVVVCILTLVAASTPAEAFFFPSFYRCYRPCAPVCAPAPCTAAYYGPIGYSAYRVSYYSPYVSSYCGSTCAPCGSACGSICGIACGSTCGIGCSPCGPTGCPGGICGVDYTAPANSGGTQPTPATEAPPKTFKNDSNDSEWQESQPSEESESDSDGSSTIDSSPSTDDDGLFGGRESRKVPPTTILQRKPAPTAAPAGGEGRTTVDETGTGAVPLLVPSLDLDQVFAGSARPTRARLTIRTRILGPKMVRRSIRHNNDWVPVSASDQKIAAK